MNRLSPRPKQHPIPIEYLIHTNGKIVILVRRPAGRPALILVVSVDCICSFSIYNICHTIILLIISHTFISNSINQ